MTAGSLTVNSPDPWPSANSLALNSTNLVSPSSIRNLNEPAAVAPSEPAETRPGKTRHTINNAIVKAPIMLFIKGSPRKLIKILVGRSVGTLSRQSRLAPAIRMNKNQHYRITRIFKAVPATLFLFGIFGLISTTAAAQGGNIRGKVVADIPDQRRILPGVAVTLSGERLGEKKLQSVTDLEGQYDFPSLVAGEYLVTVEFSGFKKYEKKLSVQIEATVEHDILLQPVPLTENVTVTDDRTDGSKTESTTPSVITDQALRDAPLIDQKFQDALSGTGCRRIFC